MTPMTMKMTVYQYVMRNFFNEAILSSDKSSFRSVSNGPDGSTYKKLGYNKYFAVLGFTKTVNSSQHSDYYLWWNNISIMLVNIYLSAFLKNVTITLVVVTRCSRFWKHVGNIQRRFIKLKWWSAFLTLPGKFAT